MSLKRERVEHLDHQCELNAPVIINIVICYCYCYFYLDHQCELNAPVIINIVVIVIVTTTVHHT